MYIYTNPILLHQHRGPTFDLIATANLTLSEASDLPHTHDLNLSPNNGSNATMKPPLFGHFCCRLAVQPDAVEQPQYSGHLRITSKDNNTHAIESFVRLQAFKLETWEDKSSCENNMHPEQVIEINRDTKLKIKNEKIILVQNMREGNHEEHSFHFETPEEAIKWNGIFKKAIKEHIQWGHIAINPMTLSIPGNTKLYNRQPRQGSLYDQVPVNNASNNRQSRPTVHDIFAIPNSVKTSPNLQEDFRRRTYSSGPSRSQSNSTLSSDSMTSVNSSSSSARRSHWPLFGGDK